MFSHLGNRQVLILAKWVGWKLWFPHHSDYKHGAVSQVLMYSEGNFPARCSLSIIAVLLSSDMGSKFCYSTCGLRNKHTTWSGCRICSSICVSSSENNAYRVLLLSCLLTLQKVFKIRSFVFLRKLLSIFWKNTPN